jgi:hypothetical protein
VPGFGTTDWVALKADVFDASNGFIVKVWDKGCAQIQMNVQSNWLGVNVGGFRNGVICGFGETFSTSATNTWCLTTALCSDPEGSQTFKSEASGLVWSGNGYEFRGYQLSPTINH